jgi:crossover junction endodeoxyribonuclease RusA
MRGQDLSEASSQVSARLCLTLPLPPSINEQYATVGGRRVLTSVARRFKSAVKEQVRGLKLEGRVNERLLARFRDGYLAVYMGFYFGSPLKRDLDGGLKISLDALVTEALGINDNRVVDIHLSKFIDPLRERLEVELDVLPDWRFDQEYVVLSPRTTV